MTSNAIVTTPHHSYTSHNELMAIAITAEGKCRDLGGSFRHHKFYTVAQFPTVELRREFAMWLTEHEHSWFAPGEGTEPLAIAYRPARIKY